MQMAVEVNPMLTDTCKVGHVGLCISQAVGIGCAVAIGVYHAAAVGVGYAASVESTFA